jgi:catechol 2,3-dioxygenase-like lactoylglutathione lyase family enzyme
LLTCNHIGFNVKSLTKARDFYVDKLGLELLEETNMFFAVTAGKLRLSFTKDPEKLGKSELISHTNLMLQTRDLQKTRDELVSKGVVLKYDITDVNGYKFFTIEDPDNNVIHIGEKVD